MSLAEIEEEEKPGVWGAEALHKCSLLCRGEYHETKCPVAAVLRDSYCTPRWLTDKLPLVDLDPCSNGRTTVYSRLQFHEHDDGLSLSWKGKSVFVNGPFSNLMPWARKAGEAKAFIYLVNEDSSVKWWHELVRNGGEYLFKFTKRIEYAAPPRIRVSRNNKPSALVCNWEGASMIGSALDEFGTWWSKGAHRVQSL